MVVVSAMATFKDYFNKASRITFIMVGVLAMATLKLDDLTDPKNSAINDWIEIIEYNVETDGQHWSHGIFESFEKSAFDYQNKFNKFNDQIIVRKCIKT